MNNNDSINNNGKKGGKEKSKSSLEIWQLRRQDRIPPLPHLLQPRLDGSLKNLASNSYPRSDSGLCFYWGQIVHFTHRTEADPEVPSCRQIMAILATGSNPSSQQRCINPLTPKYVHLHTFDLGVHANYSLQVWICKIQKVNITRRQVEMYVSVRVHWTDC